MIQLWLREPAWIQTSGPVEISAAPERSKREEMLHWRVAEVVAFLEQSDLSGPAKVCHHNGVAGSDLLQLSEKDLVDDLKMTPFAARKVVAIRDSFLFSKDSRSGVSITIPSDT